MSTNVKALKSKLNIFYTYLKLVIC